MSATDPRLRQIKIKTGVVKRIGKEKTMYGKEVLKEEERLEKFKTEGKDEHDIRKQEEVLQESKMMIPDCRRRLMAAHEELTKMLEEEADLNETEEFKAAQEVLEDASKQLAEVQ
ncbi:PREDICTED: tubulin-specific chaperone A-like [Branchiostoma belcheri]|uniref:Tubulin-specific chaperone A n=1 Tax=Branchiostoma belcheri TaxID=7741 RepID=A0A6P4XK85_BRABE|nr:PREDICTED: tubulin-specific chaperone A-like [Branchiostoma belcheri]